MSLIAAITASMQRRDIASMLELSRTVRLSYGSVYGVLNRWHAPNKRTLPTWARFCGISQAKAAELVAADRFDQAPGSPKRRAKKSKAAAAPQRTVARTTVRKAAKRPTRKRSQPSAALVANDDPAGGEQMNLQLESMNE